METRLSLAPGQNGTKKLLARYGERLVRVRYRYDAARGVRHKTVELIVETIPWNPRRRNARREPEDMVAVRIAFSETALRERIKAAGAIWRPRQRLWEVNWKTVRELGLLDRVVVEDMRYTPIHSLRTHTQISVIAWLPMPIYVFGIPRMPSITSYTATESRHFVGIVLR